MCVDNFNLEAMQCLVRNFYCEKKYPMLDVLLLAVKEKELFSGEPIA